MIQIWPLKRDAMFNVLNELGLAPDSDKKKKDK